MLAGGSRGVLGAKHTTGESASLDTHVRITSCSWLPAGKLLLSRHGEWVLLEAPATAPLIRLYKQAQSQVGQGPPEGHPASGDRQIHRGFSVAGDGTERGARLR